MLIEALLLCATINIIWMRMLYLKCDRNDAFVVGNVASSAQLGNANYPEEDFVNDLKYALAAASDYIYGIDMQEYAMAITKVDSDEIIATSEFDMFTITYDTDGSSRLLTCGNENWQELFDDYNDKSVRLDIKSFYIYGNKFYIGEVDVVEYDEYYPVWEKGVLEHADLTPENADEMERFKGEFVSITMGSKPSSEAAKYLELTMNDEYPEFFGGIGQHYFNVDGDEYVIHFAYTLDYRTSGAYAIAISCAVVIVIGITAAFVVSRSTYNKYCAQYEIDEYRRNMTSALAHDLKTPLTAIMGYSENLKSNVHSEKRDYYADAVIENVRYMNEIITGTLELAKIEEQDSKLNKTDIDMVALANELLVKYKADFEDRGIAVSVSGKCTVKADRELISRAVENLITNAVKYTSDGGKVEITANEKQLVICNSCDEKLTGKTEDFCKAFGKADASRSNRKGSGMGLAIVKNIALLHKFRLEAAASGGKFTAKIIFK